MCFIFDLNAIVLVHKDKSSINSILRAPLDRQDATQQTHNTATPFRLLVEQNSQTSAQDFEEWKPTERLFPEVLSEFQTRCRNAALPRKSENAVWPNTDDPEKLANKPIGKFYAPPIDITARRYA
jgi:hypothetical protein